MEWPAFGALPDSAVAAHLQAARPPCWAVAGGGTRRAYLAQGGQLAHPTDLPHYLRWLEGEHRALLERLFDLGVTTLISTEHVPLDRGTTYLRYAVEGLRAAVDGPERRNWYAGRDIRVAIAGDVSLLATHLATPEIVDEWQRLVAETTQASGPTLIYLFRGDWIEAATEEAHIGYDLGIHLGRMPTRDELVHRFYGCPVPPLTVYLGSGRPHLRHLRPPFLGGYEDCYWSYNPLLQLSSRGIRRVIYDHLWNRRTIGSRSYADDAGARAALTTSLSAQADRVLGIGHKNALGFWLPVGDDGADQYP
jgi:hypothetical protein